MHKLLGSNQQPIHRLRKSESILKERAKRKIDPT